MTQFKQSANEVEHFQRLLGVRPLTGAASIERYGFMIRRAQLIAGVLAYLTLSWIIVDFLTMNVGCWAHVAIARAVATVAFLAVARANPTVKSAEVAHGMLAALLGITASFFLVGFAIIDLHSEHGYSPMADMLYLNAPYFLAALLSLFPMTALNVAAYSVPVLFTLGTFLYIVADHQLDVSSIEMTWRMAVLVVIAAAASMSQLQLLVELTERTARDVLTGVYTRLMGEQLVRQQFAQSVRSSSCFTLLFVDLDHFKAVNDRFGHTAGDVLLSAVAQKISASVREQDTVIRWGGEEFVVVLPDTDVAGADAMIQRLVGPGIDLRPDGTPQTLSIGVAERKVDGALRWNDLVSLADNRMYTAKQNGRNRCVLPDAAEPHAEPGTALSGCPLPRVA